VVLGVRSFGEENRADIDTIDMDVPLNDTPVVGVPLGLQDVIRDWVESNPEQARSWAA
jgi:hypothetical protein